MSFSIQKYFEVLQDLLGEKGCPWSKNQSLSSMCHYVIEEAYEVLDAVKQEDPAKIKEELGDLLFTISFLTTLALKEHQIDFDHLVQEGANKVVRRSPHVFPTPKPITLEELRLQWEASKAEERKNKNENPLDAVATSLPALSRAIKWAELATKYGYQPQFRENVLGDRLLKLVFEASNNLKNADVLFEDSLKNFEGDFRSWMETQDYLSKEL